METYKVSSSLQDSKDMRKGEQTTNGGCGSQENSWAPFFAGDSRACYRLRDKEIWDLLLALPSPDI